MYTYTYIHKIYMHTQSETQRAPLLPHQLPARRQCRRHSPRTKPRIPWSCPLTAAHQLPLPRACPTVHVKRPRAPRAGHRDHRAKHFAHSTFQLYTHEPQHTLQNRVVAAGGWVAARHRTTTQTTYYNGNIYSESERARARAHSSCARAASSRHAPAGWPLAWRRGAQPE